MRASDGSIFWKRVAALSLKLRTGQFFSRRTAAKLHGLPVTRFRDEARIEVGAIRPIRPPRRPQVEGHQLKPGALLSMPRQPNWLPSVEESWCLLAQVSSKVELLAAGDFIVSGADRFAEPFSSLTALREAAQRFRGCTGSVLLHETLPLIRTGVESPMESELRLIIVEAGLPEPRTCCPVQCRDRLRYADLGYPKLRIAIEYDGAYHFGGHAVEQSRRDIARARAMESAGWRVLRVTVHDLRAPRAFLSELGHAILERSR